MQQYPVIVLMVSLCVVWANAHAKPTIDLPRAGDSATPGQQLQQVVNDPANAGVQIRLAAGTYLLDPAAPNGGRLFLQPEMDLIGSNDYLDCDDDGVWDPLAACLGGALDPDQFAVDGSETLIDGTAISGGGAAVVRAGRDNRISRVTIRAPRIQTVAGSLDLNLVPSSGGVSAVVTDSILEGGQRGIRCNNGAPAMSGISSFASIERNIVRNNKPVPGGLFGFGVQIQNSGATGSSWTVHLRGNRIAASRFGLFFVSNNAQGAETRILSNGNLIHDNELGGFILPAFAPLGGRPGDSSSNNSMRWDSMDDAFVDNVTPADNPDPFLGLGGGLMAFAAGRDSPTSGTHSGNQLSLQLLGAKFSGNIGIAGPRNLTLIGSFASAISGPETGTNNTLKVLMRNTSSDEEAGAFVFADSVPGDPAGSNRVILIGSDVAFEQTNPAVEVPAEGFFPPWEQ